MEKLFLAMLISFLGVGILNAEEATNKKSVKESPKVVNLLRNGGFEDGVKKIWKANFIPEVEQNEVYEGKKSLRVPDNAKNFKLVQYIKKGEERYTFKLTCKVKGTSGKSFYGSIVLNYKKNGIKKCQKKNGKVLVLNGEWQGYNWTFSTVKHPGWLAIILRGSQGGICFDYAFLTNGKNENK